MDSGDDGSAPPPSDPPPSYFPWNRLPISVQETILLLLPVSTLIVCTSVSRSLRSTIRSPAFNSSYSRQPRRRDQDLLFLLLPDSSREGRVAAYFPSRDRWLHLLLPQGLRDPVASGGSLLMEELEVDKGVILVSNPLRPAQTTALLPPMEPLPYSYALALIEIFPPHYMIVSVTTTDQQVRSQVFDSRSCRWHIRGHLPLQFAMLGNAAYLNGLLYCLSRGPDHLLTFDPVGGEWTLVNVAMPAHALVCSHIMVFNGGLFLVAGVEDAGVIIEVGIWEFDLEKKLWRVVCFMPEEFFGLFGNKRHKYFETVDRAGKICFFNWTVNLFLMFDLEERRWWWPRRCDISCDNRRLWFGQALEPQIHLVM